MDRSSEKALLVELQRSKQRAFAEVYQEFNDGVFACYCLMILADRQPAQDVVQETFLKVWRHATEFSTMNRLGHRFSGLRAMKP